MSPAPFSDLHVAPVDYDVAKKMTVENHYSKTWNGSFGAENYGIFHGDTLLGVAVYGRPKNPASARRVASVDPMQVIELNRLWIDDVLGTNTETWMLGQTFRLLREAGYQVVQSFADGRLGVGTIYQAANFTYHGYHETIFFEDVTDGTVYHPTSFSNTSVVGPFIHRNLLLTEPGRLNAFSVRTYRYLYPLTKYGRRRILLPSRPYPKERAGMRPVDDYTPPPQQIARAAALAEAVGRDEEARRLTTYLATLHDDPLALLATQRSNRWIVAAREGRSPEQERERFREEQQRKKQQ